MGVRVDRHESGGHQVILVTTNVGDVVAVDDAHPLRVETNRQTGEPSTYVRVRGGLEARLGRPAWYELISWAEADAGKATMSVMSSGVRFPVGEIGLSDDLHRQGRLPRALPALVSRRWTRSSKEPVRTDYDLNPDWRAPHGCRFPPCGRAGRA